MTPFVQIDADPKPLSYWAEKWGKHTRTIERWIKDGECPVLVIGGVKMISAVQLLNWEPPEDHAKTSESRGTVQEAAERQSEIVPDGGWGPTLRASRQNKRGGKGKLRGNARGEEPA